MKFKSMCLISIAIIASLAIVAASNSNRVGGNNEGVNATVFDIFNVLGDSLTYVDVFIDANASVSAKVKLVDMNDVIYDMTGSGMNELGDGRYICAFYPPDSTKIKYIRVESTVRGEYKRFDKELTPFLVKVNETPDIIEPHKSGDGIFEGDQKKTLIEFYSSNVTSNSTINNISISPEKIYLTEAGYGKYEVSWVLGMKLENRGLNPQVINSEDFNFEDQYGWKYRPVGFMSYNPNAVIYWYMANRESIDRKFTLLPGEALWKGLIFNKISAISMPDLLEYMNEGIKMDNVTSGTIESI